VDKLFQRAIIDIRKLHVADHGTESAHMASECVQRRGRYRLSFARSNVCQPPLRLFAECGAIDHYGSFNPASAASFSISDLHSAINSSSTHSSNIRKTPLVNCVVLNKHLSPLLSKLGLERGGMHGFRHHRVSTLVMAGTPMVVIKKWIGQR
jgi:hypothetical protein